MKSTLIEIDSELDEEKYTLLINFLNDNRILFQQKAHTKTNPRSSIDSKLLVSKGLQVLDLLSRGFTYAEIASKLNITVDGVRYYIKKTYKTLGVSNSAEAVRYYVKNLE